MTTNSPDAGVDDVTLYNMASLYEREKETLGSLPPGQQRRGAMRAALTLLPSPPSREETIEECARAIEAHQNSFLRDGDRWMRNGDGTEFRVKDVAPDLERERLENLRARGLKDETPFEKAAAIVRALHKGE